MVHSVMENIFDIDLAGIDKSNCKSILREKAQGLLVHYWNKSREELVKLGVDENQEQMVFSETLLMVMNWADAFSKKVIAHPEDFAAAWKEHTPQREQLLRSEELFVQGFVDAIETIKGQVRIMDYKTSKKDDISDEYKLQLGIYAMLYKEKHGVAPEKVGIYFLKDTGHTEKIINVDQDLMDLAKLEVELVHMQTASEEIHDYPRRVTPLCKWSTGQCDHYIKCFREDKDK